MFYLKTNNLSVVWGAKGVRRVTDKYGQPPRESSNSFQLLSNNNTKFPFNALTTLTHLPYT